MNVPNPALPTRPLPLKPQWIAAGVLLVVLYLLLRPWLVERFGLVLPGFTDVAPKAEVTAPDTTAEARKASDKNRPVDVPVIPEQTETVTNDEVATSDSSPTEPTVVPPPEATSRSTNAPRASSPPKPDSNPSVARRDPSTGSLQKSPAAQSEPRPGTAKATPPKPTPPPAKTPAPPTVATQNSKPKPKPGTPAGSPPATPEKSSLGVLKPTGRGRFESTAGLVYDQYRIDHVMEHSHDNTDKPSHGVFDAGTQDEVLALVDEAFQLAQKRGPPDVIIEDEGDRTTYRVNMNRKVGHAGGQSGARRRNPPLKMVKIVLEGDRVITAFPTN